MTTATAAHRLAVPPAEPRLTDLIAAVRHVIVMRADWARTALLVADQLRAHLPGPAILPPGQRRGRPGLPASHVRDNHPGEVNGFAPPGDIHRIRNTGTRTAISLHIYGTDITRIGSSARRYYS